VEVKYHPPLRILPLHHIFFSEWHCRARRWYGNICTGTTLRGKKNRRHVWGSWMWWSGVYSVGCVLGVVKQQQHNTNKYLTKRREIDRYTHRHIHSYKLVVLPRSSTI
jgi:hypothetical protein